MSRKVTGSEYENLCAKLLRDKGFRKVCVTRESGDQGVDITAYKKREKYAVQCKYYSSAVSNKAVQEVVAGMNFYNCSKAIVITNNKFTKSAKDLAMANDVELWPNVGTGSTLFAVRRSFRSMRAGRRRIGLIIILILLCVVLFLIILPITQGISGQGSFNEIYGE